MKVIHSNFRVDRWVRKETLTVFVLCSLFASLNSAHWIVACIGTLVFGGFSWPTWTMQRYMSRIKTSLSVGIKTYTTEAILRYTGCMVPNYCAKIVNPVALLIWCSNLCGLQNSSDRRKSHTTHVPFTKSLTTCRFILTVGGFKSSNWCDWLILSVRLRHCLWMWSIGV